MIAPFLTWFFIGGMANSKPRVLDDRIFDDYVIKKAVTMSPLAYTIFSWGPGAWFLVLGLKSNPFWLRLFQTQLVAETK